jgi:hypothetical protein
MIGYLAAIESRDISPSVRESGSNIQARVADQITPILPRLPSEYEAWRAAPNDHPAAEMEVSDEKEDRVRPPIEDTPRAPFHAERKVEANTLKEAQHQQSDKATSIDQTIDSTIKVRRESVSRRNENLHTAEQHAPSPPERRSTTAPHAAFNAPSDIVTATSGLPAVVASRQSSLTDATRPMSSRRLIIPQIREAPRVDSRANDSESRTHRNSENALPEKPEPSVVVTIGKIEVRAVTRPSPPRSNPERQQQLMSLDEYLAQRVRGLR